MTTQKQQRLIELTRVLLDPTQTDDQRTLAEERYFEVVSAGASCDFYEIQRQEYKVSCREMRR